MLTGVLRPVVLFDVLAKHLFAQDQPLHQKRLDVEFDDGRAVPEGIQIIYFDLAFGDAVDDLHLLCWILDFGLVLTPQPLLPRLAALRGR